MKKFELCGIKPPGRVDIQGMGTINLCEIDDNMAALLYKKGVPFIRPKAQVRQEIFPDQKPIEPKPAPKRKPAGKTKTQSKK